MAERIGHLLPLDVVFRQNDFARQLRMVGINARIHDGNDDGRIAQGGVPGLLRPNELRRPLGYIAVVGGWIGRGVIGIVRHELCLYDIVECY